MVHFGYYWVFWILDILLLSVEEEHVRPESLTNHLHTIASIARLAVILSQPTCCLNSGPMY